MPAYRLALPYERPPLQRRASGFALALGINLILLFLLLGLGVRLPIARGKSGALVIDLFPPSHQAEHEESKAAPARSRPMPPTPKPPPIVLPVKPTITPPKPWPVIELSHQELADADVRNLPKAAASSSGASDDSEVVGHGPHGETLYGAEWAREPTDQELGFYLPKDAPDGYGLIACKTYPQNRVDDCVALESYPASAHLDRAVLNAAWQFKVRPPRKNGKPMIGEWVQIRIDYVRSNAGGRD